MRTLNLVGKKFSKLTVKEKVSTKGKSYFRCECDCGNSKVLAGWRISAGKVQSCGCARKDADKTRNVDKRLEKGLSCARRVVYYYQRNARKRGIEFHLSEKECLEIFRQNCTYCGRPPFNIISYKGYHGELVYTGIDRADNTKGYTLENSVPCCKDCNYMKRDLNKEEFIKIISLIYENISKIW